MTHTDARIIVRPGAVDRPQENDVLYVANRREIRRRHTWMAVKPKHSSGVFRPADGLLARYCETILELKFERIAPFMQRITNLWTNDVREERDQGLPAYLSTKLAHENHMLFGSRGSEVWYGGRRDWSGDTLLAVSAMLEANSDWRDADHADYPFGTQDKKSFLCVRLDSDLSEVDVDDINTPDREEGWIDRHGVSHDVEYRRCRCSVPDWRAIAGRRVADVLNRDVEVDMRDSPIIAGLVGHKLALSDAEKLVICERQGLEEPDRLRR